MCRMMAEEREVYEVFRWRKVHKLKLLGSLWLNGFRDCNGTWNPLVSIKLNNEIIAAAERQNN
jgi:hypothetical protein